MVEFSIGFLNSTVDFGVRSDWRDLSSSFMSVIPASSLTLDVPGEHSADVKQPSELLSESPAALSWMQAISKEKVDTLKQERRNANLVIFTNHT